MQGTLYFQGEVAKSASQDIVQNEDLAIKDGTHAKLDDLKKNVDAIKRFDETVFKVKELQIQIETAEGQRENALSLVQKRFEGYLTQIESINPDSLNAEQRVLYFQTLSLVQSIYDDLDSYYDNQEQILRSESNNTDEYYEAESLSVEQGKEIVSGFGAIFETLNTTIKNGRTQIRTDVFTSLEQKLLATLDAQQSSIPYLQTFLKKLRSIKHELKNITRSKEHDSVFKYLSPAEQTAYDQQLVQEVMRSTTQLMQVSDDFLQLSDGNFKTGKFLDNSFTYTVQSGDTLAKIVEEQFGFQDSKKRESIVAQLKKEEVNPRTLRPGQKIDMSLLVIQNQFDVQEEASPEVQAQYHNGLTTEWILQGAHFPLNLLQNEFMQNDVRGSAHPMCAASMYEFERFTFQDAPPSFDPSLGGQQDAYKVLPQVMKAITGGKKIDTGTNTIQVRALNLSDYDIAQNYGQALPYKLRTKFSKKIFKEQFGKPHTGQVVHIDGRDYTVKVYQDGRDYIDLTSRHEMRFAKEGAHPFNVANRIINLDGTWYSLDMNRDSLKEKRSKIYEAANDPKNAMGYIFWHYSLTNEWGKIIDSLKGYSFVNDLSQEQQNAIKDDPFADIQLGESTESSSTDYSDPFADIELGDKNARSATHNEREIPPSGHGSHFTINFGRKKVLYDVYDVQKITEADLGEKLSVREALNTLISQWKNPRDIDTAAIFSQVKIAIYEDGKVLDGTQTDLYELHKNPQSAFLDLELEENQELMVEDVTIIDEYEGKGRVMQLTKLLTEVEGSGAEFLPTDVVRVPKKYRQTIIPKFVEDIKNIWGIDFASMDTPQLVAIPDAKTDASTLGVEFPFNAEEQQKIYNYYNRNFAKDGLPQAFPGDAQHNTIFFRYNRKTEEVSFHKVESTFDEMFDRWKTEGKYKEEDRNRVRYFLKKIDNALPAHFPKRITDGIKNTTVFPIFKFETYSTPEAEHFQTGEVRSLRELQTLKFGPKKEQTFENMDTKLFNAINNVAGSNYDKAVLLSMWRFETGSAGVRTKSIELGAEVTQWALDTVGSKTAILSSVGPFETNYIYTKAALQEYFNGKLSPNISAEYQAKLAKNKEDLLKMSNIEIRDKINDDPEFATFASLLTIAEKRRTAEVRALTYYGDEYYTMSSGENFQKEQEILALSMYIGKADEYLIRGQSYIVQRLLAYKNSGFSNPQVEVDTKFQKEVTETELEEKGLQELPKGHIRPKIDKVFEKELQEVLNTPQFQAVLAKKGIIVTDTSFKGSIYKHNGSDYTSSGDKILGGKDFQDFMKGKKGDNVFHALRVIYESIFGRPAPLLMTPQFREEYQFAYMRKQSAKALWGKTKSLGGKLIGIDVEREFKTNARQSFRGKNVLVDVDKFLKKTD